MRGPLVHRVLSRSVAAATAMIAAVAVASCADGRPSTGGAGSASGRSSAQGAVHRDLAYVPDGVAAQRLDLYLPAAPDDPTGASTGTGRSTTGTGHSTTGTGHPAFPLVVFVHGGRWAEGDKSGIDSAEGENFRSFKELLLSHGYAVASLNYRLSAEATWPAQLYDVKAATRYLRANAARYRLDPRRVAAIGDSAGGHLALMLGFTAGDPALEGTLGNPGVSSAVQAVVSYYGVSDLRHREQQRQEAGCEARDGAVSSEGKLLGAEPVTPAGAALAAQASPLLRVARTDPPTLLFHGSKDCNVPAVQSRTLYAALKAAGVTTELTVIDAAHAQPEFYLTPALRDQLIRFLAATLVAR